MVRHGAFGDRPRQKIELSEYLIALAVLMKKHRMIWLKLSSKEGTLRIIHSMF
jgi:hypothetical protein